MKGVLKIGRVKRILSKFRTSIKLISLVGIASVIIIGAVSLIYKPTYSVTLEGEFLGYINNKAELQKKINEYIKYGSENNVAFVEIETLPEYQLCLLKKDIVTNDDEIFEKVKSLGTTYYRYYAVLESTEPKAYVATYDEAEKIIEELKNKSSANQDKLTYVEVYETELQDFTTVESAVASLYQKPVEKVVKKTTSKITISSKMSNEKKNLGISLIKPISGTITSRFGSRSSVRVGAHTGLDIAAPKGTPIKAAAAGTVIHAGWKGSLGNLVIVSHGNGVQTYYGHCSSICVSAGDTVAQGDVVAKVGSTGNSTGNHLHLEIRVNGVALNPQNYLY